MSLQNMIFEWNSSQHCAAVLQTLRPVFTGSECKFRVSSTVCLCVQGMTQSRRFVTAWDVPGHWPPHMGDWLTPLSSLQVRNRNRHATQPKVFFNRLQQPESHVYTHTAQVFVLKAWSLVGFSPFKDWLQQMPRTNKMETSSQHQATRKSSNTHRCRNHRNWARGGQPNTVRTVSEVLLQNRQNIIEIYCFGASETQTFWGIRSNYWNQPNKTLQLPLVCLIDCL